jgi:hypothetical protein
LSAVLVEGMVLWIAASVVCSFIFDLTILVTSAFAPRPRGDPNTPADG